MIAIYRSCLYFINCPQCFQNYYRIIRVELFHFFKIINIKCKKMLLYFLILLLINILV